jgi:hypothetical protein
VVDELLDHSRCPTVAVVSRQLIVANGRAAHSASAVTSTECWIGGS